MSHQFANAPAYWQPRPVDVIVPADDRVYTRALPDPFNYVYFPGRIRNLPPASHTHPPRDPVPRVAHRSHADPVDVPPPRPGLDDEYDYPPPWQGKGIWENRGWGQRGRGMRGRGRGRGRGDWPMGLTTSTRSVIGCPPHAYGKSRQPLQPPPPLSAVTAAADAQQPERAPQFLDPSAPSFSPGNTVRPSSSNDADVDINYYMASASSARGSSMRVGNHVTNSPPSHELASSQETKKSVMAVSKLESLVLSSTTRITPGIPAEDGSSVVSQTATIVPDAASNPENASPSSAIFYVSSGGEGEDAADRTPTSPTAHAGGPHGTVETGTGTPASAEALVKPEPTESICPSPPCHAHAPIQSIASPVPRTSSAASSSSYNSFSSDSGTSETHVLSPASPNGSASAAQQLLAGRIDRLEAQILLLQDELQALRLEIGHISHT